MFNRLPDPTPTSQRLFFVLGLAITVALGLRDATLEGDQILTTAVVLGPFTAALICSVRQVAFIGVVAVGFALLSPLWTESGISFTHEIRQLTVIAGSLASVLVAGSRVRQSAARARLRLLVLLADVSTRESVGQRAQRMSRHLVPEVADICMIEVVRDGRIERLAIEADHPNPGRVGEALRAVLDSVSGETMATPGAPLLVDVDDEVLANPPAGAGILRELEAESIVMAPLKLDGERIGALILARGRRRRAFDRDEVTFAQALAGRVALALRNAGLTREVSEIEKRYGAAIDAMGAPVLLQRPGEGIVYANRAAAKAFGLPDAEGVIKSTPEEIAKSWITTDAEGKLLSADRYPSRMILEGRDLHPQPLVTHGVHKETGREMWMTVTATPVFNTEGELDLAVSISEDITEIKRSELFKDMLARTGHLLSERSGDEAVLQDFADLLVPDLADWCSVSLRGRGKTIDQVAVAHRDPEKVAFAREYQRRYPGSLEDPGGSAAILRGEPSVLSEVTSEALEAAIDDPERLAMLQQLGLRWVIQVPIEGSGGHRFGALNLVNAESRRHFTPAHLELAEELGRRLGLAMENARLYADQAEASRVLQMALMPRELPAMRGFEAHATYRPAGQGNIVGGDFYDAFRTATSWVIVVGDIAGRGIKAAALTAQARHVMRSNTMFTGDIVQAVTHLNHVLTSEPRLSLCTIGAIELPDDPEARPVRILCAGHPSPVLVRDGEAREVGAWGPMVGAFADSEFDASELHLRRGDLLVLFTDGLTDVKGREGRFGEERVMPLLAQAESAADTIALITDALDDFGAERDSDDTAVVAVKWVGEGEALYGGPEQRGAVERSA